MEVQLGPKHIASDVSAQLAALDAQVQGGRKTVAVGARKGQLSASPGKGQQEGEGTRQGRRGATYALAKRLCVSEFLQEVTHRQQTSFHVR